MNCKKLFILLSAILISATTFSADPNSEQVQSDVKKASQALFIGDVETILFYTHPKVMELMGGHAQATQTLKAGLLQQMSKMTLDEFEFTSAPKFFDGVENHYVFVPNLLKFHGEGQKVEMTSFQLGVKAKGSDKWTYIDGTNINSQNVLSLVPDFPVSVKFPPVNIRN